MTRFLAEATSVRPHAIAVDDGERRWTFVELLDRSARAGAVLREQGAGPGRTAVLEADPSIEALVALHGLLHTGALLAPLHPDLAPPERAAALAALDPAVIVGPRGLPLDDLAAAAARAEPGPASPSRDPTAPAAVLWTSGTSGKPRGILLSERGFRASAEATRARLALTADDVWYAALSPAHVGGLALLLRAALLGSGLALRGRYSLVELDTLLDAGRITHVSLVPTMLLRLLERRHARPAPRGLRCVLVGGAHTPRPLVDRALAAGLPIALTYGLTEATSQVATASPDEVRSDPDGVGRPLDGLEVRISENGEILVRGATVAPGLLGGGTLTDEDGWLATGDLGSLDADGRLRVTGRRSDRIVSGGATVDAYEVEAVLRTHPSIADACVVGLADPTWGQRVAAAVVGIPGREVDPEGLREWLRPRLSPAKRPKRIHPMVALPRNPNGKVDRAAVLRLVVRAESGTPRRQPGFSPAMHADRFREVLSHWAATVGVAAVRDEGRVYGTTITSFTPVNADPPVVLVSLGPSAQVLPFLQTGSRFTINLLEESQSRWAEVFADPYPVGASPFAESGDPILDGAMVWLTCRVEAVVEAGRGARLVLGAVLDGEAGAGLRPLLWHRRGPTHLPPDR